MAQSICIFILVTFVGVALGATPMGQITFVNETDLMVQEPIPLLPNEPIRDVCVIGTFVTYDGADYTWEGVMVTYWYYPVNDTGVFCWGNMSYVAGSARPIAHGVDTQEGFVSFFSGQHKQFDELVISETQSSEVASIPFRINSMLLRKTSVELFSEPDFQGETYCVYDCEQLICDYSDMDDVPGGKPWDIRYAKSARLGCPTQAHTVEAVATRNTSEDMPGFHVSRK